MKELPKSAQVVVIGGGIVGCSTAYHLAKLGVETVRRCFRIAKPQRRPGTRCHQ
ncbi:MAG: FAD-dependent oxidoreductase [Rhodobacteraceae bacterium]|nr:FAD-dependent oxidoreductase [Paracoccaceae bacterium]